MLPDAELKLYLEVSLAERALRRAADRDLAPASPAAAAILGDLRRRDHLDSSRDVAPLRVPDDAVIVSSDGRHFRGHRRRGGTAAPGREHAGSCTIP